MEWDGKKTNKVQIRKANHQALIILWIIKLICFVLEKLFKYCYIPVTINLRKKSGLALDEMS
jgi:hypothetical protein